nr:hypothetical protein [uncultured Halomonas sp.]
MSVNEKTTNAGIALNKSTPLSAPMWLRIALELFLLLWSLGFPVAKGGTSYVDPIIFLALALVSPRRQLNR